MDELESGGVPLLLTEDDDEEASTGANCDVPNLRIAWDYINATNAYTATFLAGPLAGQNVVSKLSNLTPAKWANIQPPRDVNFEDADFDQKRDGLYFYLKGHCATMLASAN